MAAKLAFQVLSQFTVYSTSRLYLNTFLPIKGVGNDIIRVLYEIIRDMVRIFWAWHAVLMCMAIMLKIYMQELFLKTEREIQRYRYSRNDFTNFEYSYTFGFIYIYLGWLFHSP